MNDNEGSSAIFAEIDGFTNAWNAGDAKAAASFFTEDAVRVGAMGDVQRGRAELEAAYERLLQQAMAGATVTQDRGTVRMLAPDLAIWQGGMVINLPDGSSRRGHVVQVMKKVDGRWLVLETHPKFFPPPQR
jgi:uncharacterized protein (TIGR02246 family)